MKHDDEFGGPKTSHSAECWRFDLKVPGTNRFSGDRFGFMIPKWNSHSIANAPYISMPQMFLPLEIRMKPPSPNENEQLVFKRAGSIDASSLLYSNWTAYPKSHSTSSNWRKTKRLEFQRKCSVVFNGQTFNSTKKSPLKSNNPFR